MKLSLKTKLNAAFAILCTAITIVVAAVGILVAENEARLKQIRVSYDVGAKVVLPFVKTALGMQLDVTQVQQYLSDISATRGQDGLDDGFKMAEESAASFRKHVSDGSALVDRLEMPELTAAIKAAADAFEPYYATGRRMAETYVASGPAGGNALMEGFDGQADMLRKSLETLISMTEKIAGARNEATSEAIRNMEVAFGVEQNVGLIASVLLVASIIATVIFLRRAFLSPVVALAGQMRELAKGNLEVVMSGASRADEIGEISGAVEEFKIKAAEKARKDVEQKQAEQRAAEAQRRVEMLRLADQFQSAIGGIIETVASAAGRLEGAAATLTRTADSTQQLSNMVAAASEETSANVQGVAAASEQLSSTVTEISRQVHTSSAIANQAVTQAERTNQSVVELSQSADRIGDVVELINNIASQTNLLALNATIEAARAGEAGKGFAIVAQEVKALAAQTAKATSEIGSQIAGMQAATQHAVGAIQEITTTITEINGIAGTIAAAVEQQGATTKEISRNVAEAAKGTCEVASSIAEVSQGASQTGVASSEVLTSANALSGESRNLKAEVERFLSMVRAA